MKVLFWLGLTLLVILALRKKVHTSLTPPTGAAKHAAPASAGDNANQGESMVCCAHCAIYVPISESVNHAGKLYCCSAHAQQSA